MKSPGEVVFIAIRRRMYSYKEDSISREYMCHSIADMCNAHMISLEEKHETHKAIARELHTGCISLSAHIIEIYGDEKGFVFDEDLEYHKREFWEAFITKYTHGVFA